MRNWMSARMGDGVGTAAVSILLVIAAGTMLASMDSLGKYLSARYDVLQVVWARYAGHSLIALVFFSLRGHGFDFLHTRRPKMQLLRSVMMLLVTGCLYSALVFVPLADATAVMFFAPVLVTLLAGPFLGETLGKHRVVAVIMGFIGVLVIVRPGLSTDWHMLLALAAAVALSLYLLMTRYIGGHDAPRSTIFYSTAFGSLVLTGVMPWIWQMPTAGDLALMASMGLLGALGHGFLVVAFARTPASVLSPFLYAQLLAASLLSVVVFGDTLEWPTVAGAGLLIGGGLVVWWWERLRGNPRRADNGRNPQSASQ